MSTLKVGEIKHESFTGTTQLKLDSAGRLMVGTDTKGQADADDFTVANSGSGGITIRTGNSNNANIFFSDATSGSAEYAGYLQYKHDHDRLDFGTATSTRMTIDSSGRVLIGTTDVGSSGVDNLILNRSGNGGLTIRNGTNNNGNIFFSDGTSGAAEYAGYFQYQHAQDTLVIGTSGSERMRIDSSGKVGIGTTAPLKTLTTKAGSNTHAFYIAANDNDNNGWGFQADSSSGHLRLDRSIGNDFNYRRICFHGDGGIAFQGDTAAANALDDYEEGTWTPTDGSGASISITNNSTATYTKIGRLVHIQFDITYASNSSSADSQLSGLPYSQGVDYGSGVVGWTDKDNANGIHTHVGATRIYLMDNSSSNSSGGKHLRNDELSNDRVIGNATYFTS